MSRVIYRYDEIGFPVGCVLVDDSPAALSPRMVREVDPARHCATLPAEIMGKRVRQRDKAEFAQKLKRWRERVGMSQSQAAAALSVPIDSLQNWEIARTMPNALAQVTLFTLMREVERGR
jgi:DNA-binding transcriptional regulator YiaG